MSTAPKFEVGQHVQVIRTGYHGRVVGRNRSGVLDVRLSSGKLVRVKPMSLRALNSATTEET